MSNEGFVSISEVATMLHVSPRTVRRLVTDGLLPVYRFSTKLVRFRADEIMEAFARVRVPAKSET